MSGFERIGALWLKEGRKGKFMSGIVGGKNILVFKNERKKPGDKFPDYEVFKGQGKDELPAREPGDEEIPF